jgi:hypothetical protein
LFEISSVYTVHIGFLGGLILRPLSWPFGSGGPWDDTAFSATQAMHRLWTGLPMHLLSIQAHFRISAVLPTIQMPKLVDLIHSFGPFDQPFNPIMNLAICGILFATQYPTPRRIAATRQDRPAILNKNGHKLAGVPSSSEGALKSFLKRSQSLIPLFTMLNSELQT